MNVSQKLNIFIIIINIFLAKKWSNILLTNAFILFYLPNIVFNIISLHLNKTLYYYAI